MLLAHRPRKDLYPMRALWVPRWQWIAADDGCINITLQHHNRFLTTCCSWKAIDPVFAGPTLAPDLGFRR